MDLRMIRSPPILLVSLHGFPIKTITNLKKKTGSPIPDPFLEDAAAAALATVDDHSQLDECGSSRLMLSGVCKFQKRPNYMAKETD